MLILQRNRGESLNINDSEIIIKVIDINRKTVRLGINAPKDVKVHRQEIYDTMLILRKMLDQNLGEKKLYQLSDALQRQMSGYQVVGDGYYY